MDDFLRVMDPNQNGFNRAMDPNQNGAKKAFEPAHIKEAFTKAFDPNQNNVANWWNGAFNRESINQQNTVIKGMFSTNKYDQEQGQQALLGGGNVPDKIYDHPIGKPNNYDPVYNPDPRLPDAPTNLNGDKNKPTSTNSTYLYIGGALIVLFVLLKK